MKKIIPLFCSLLLFSFSYSQNSPKALHLIPEPVSVVLKTGAYQLPQQLRIVGNAKSLDSIGSRLSRQLTRATGKKITYSTGSSAVKGISLQIQTGSGIPAEGYTLDVTANGVVMKASSPAGIFWGVQTLMQLLPAAAESQALVKTTTWTIPAVSIKDQPRFGWRGIMLDVSRHFFTKEEVKRFIDDMVKYKFNLLHWHLTDDQGWRIEIKSYPKLTSVGAWRVNKTGSFNTFSAPLPDEPRDYGGFYTQDDIREVVAYAKTRFVDILPEIDVPGHSLAAIAAYPELTCTPGTYVVNSGEPFMVWPPGGHFYGLVDNSLCPANEKVYEFMDKVFGEVAQLFPFAYIHMGGDETARNFWEKSEQVKDLMKRENLKDLDRVQSYFVKRMEKIISSKGKKMIGWDEILQGGLAPNAAVMSWRGMKGGIEAAKMGHEVVMTPTDFVYLDYMQSDRIMEPPVYASLRMKKTYEFEPVPEGVNASLIKGGQGNLWTEQVYNLRQIQYMIWPRAFAISETLWSPKEKKNWNTFVKKVETHFDRLAMAETKYAPSMYDADFKLSKKDSTVIVELVPEISGLDLHYSFDNSYPDQYYPKYTGPLSVPKDAVLMRVISYRNGKPIGRMMNMPVAELKKRVKL